MNLYGLLGEKLGHSFSPIIHAKVFEELDIKGHYHLFEVNKNHLENAVRGFKALGVKGVNVTIPYKVEIMKYLDQISEEAKMIGAINTIRFEGQKAIGYNTDYYGFGMMLEEYDIKLKNKRAVILGTGGATKAVVKYLLDHDIKDVTLVTRNVTRAKEEWNEFTLISYDEIKSLKEREIIINATPCGMYPNIEKSPVTKMDLSNFQTAVDLIYNPKETLFMKYGKEEGLKAINGMHMLVGQAIKAEELWNDIKIDKNIYRKICKELEYA